MKAGLRFGIIGCGQIATRHAEQAGRVGHLVAVCDNIQQKADAFGSAHGAKVYYSASDLLAKQSDVDVIIVCTPNGLHAIHSIEALKAGFHVLCEKPMAIKTSDCLEMMAAAEAAGKQLLIVKQNRFNPPVQAVKQLIKDGRLGKLYAVQVNCFWNRGEEYYKNSWRGTKELDGGTLFTQFSHFVDLLYWMLGDVNSVQSLLANYAHKGIIEFEDTGTVTLLFESGVSGTLQYTVNAYEKNMEGSFTLFAENATIKIGGEYLDKLSYQRIKGDPLPVLPPGAAANDYGGYRGSMGNHNKVYDNLVEVISNNGTAAASGFEGMKTVEIIGKIYKAARYL